MSVIEARVDHAQAVARAPMSSRTWWLILGCILAVACVVRFYNLASAPGWEWDEPVYNSIGTSMAHGTGLRSAPEFGRVSGHYLYHPPFYFLMLDAWYRLFGSGITQARYLGATASLVYIALFAIGMRRLVNPLAGLLTAGLLTFDGWLIFENRVSWLENSLMVLIGLSVLAWERALRRQDTYSWMLLGLSVGAAVIFKHIAIGVLIAAVVAFAMLYRSINRPLRSVLITLGTAGLVITIYLLVMINLFPGEFAHQSLGQLNRSTGARPSRGTVGLTSGAVGRAILLRYWLYGATGVVTIFGFILGAVRASLVWRRRAEWNGLAVPLAMGVASTMAFIVISIRFPHYFILTLVPMLAYVAGEAALAWARRPRLRKLVAAGLAAVMVLGLAGGVGRLAWPDDRNTMLDASNWLDAHAHKGDVVVTEEPIGTLVHYKHCRTSLAAPCDDYWQWLITYTSATQKLSKNTAFNRMLSESVSCITFIGFKEHVTVYGRKSTLPAQNRSC